VSEFERAFLDYL